MRPDGVSVTETTELASFVRDVAEALQRTIGHRLHVRCETCNQGLPYDYSSDRSAAASLDRLAGFITLPELRRSIKATKVDGYPGDAAHDAEVLREMVRRIKAADTVAIFGWLRACGLRERDTDPKWNLYVRPLSQAVSSAEGSLDGVPFWLSTVLRNEAWRDFEAPMVGHVHHDTITSFVTARPLQGLDTTVGRLKGFLARDAEVLALLDAELQDDAEQAEDPHD
jgi:hypothetical protein